MSTYVKLEADMFVTISCFHIIFC